MVGWRVGCISQLPLGWGLSALLEITPESAELPKTCKVAGGDVVPTRKVLPLLSCCQPGPVRTSMPKSKLSASPARSSRSTTPSCPPPLDACTAQKTSVIPPSEKDNLPDTGMVIERVVCLFRACSEMVGLRFLTLETRTRSTWIHGFWHQSFRLHAARSYCTSVRCRFEALEMGVQRIHRFYIGAPLLVF